jgi:hypothetical protein
MESRQPHGSLRGPNEAGAADHLKHCFWCLARIYIVLVGLLLGSFAIVLLLIGSGSLSLVGNNNPLSWAIPDWPDSWCLIIFGAVGASFSIGKCVAGISGSSRGCLFNNSTVICNSVLALISVLVLMGFVYSGYQLMSDAAWATVRNEATSTTGQIISPTGGNTSDTTMVDIVATICSPSFLRVGILVLVLLLALSLLFEYLLLCVDVDGRQAARAARQSNIQMHVIHHHYGQTQAVGGGRKGSLASKDQNALTVATGDEARTIASSI